MEPPACLRSCACISYVRHLEHTIYSLEAHVRLLQHNRWRQEEQTPSAQPEPDCTPRTPPASPGPSPPRKRRRRQYEQGLKSVPGLLEFRLPTYQHERIGVLVTLTPQPAMWQSRLNPLRDSLISGTGLDTMLTQSRKSNDLMDNSRRYPLCALQQFAVFTLRKTSGAEVDLAYGRFQQFILALACAVIHEQGTDLGSVSSIICAGMGEDYTGAWCKVLMQTALWVNKLVNALDNDGWNMRASELLLSWNQKLSFYCPLARSDDNIQCIVEHLRSRKVELLCTPIFIPLILHRLLQGSDMFEICRIVGSNPGLIGTAPWVHSISQ